MFSFSFGGIALEYTERTSPEEAKLNDHKLHKQPILCHLCLTLLLFSRIAAHLYPLQNVLSVLVEL
jgi:hypothetical protein